MTDEPTPPSGGGPPPEKKPSSPESAPSAKQQAAAAAKRIQMSAGRAVKKNKRSSMIFMFALVLGGMWAANKVYRHFFSAEARGEKKSGKGSTGPVAVNAIEVKENRFEDILVAVGTIVGGAEVPLRFEVDGAIAQFDYREGDKVRKGSVIARLDAREASLEYKSAEYELSQHERLFAAGGESRTVLERYRLAADIARSKLAKTVIRANQDGILGDKQAEVGEFVTPNKQIAVLVNIETVVVEIGVIEKEIDKIVPGQKVTLTVDAYRDVDFTGKVETIDTIVRGASKTLTVKARLDNDGGLLLPGMFARSKIAIFEEDRALAVPNECVEKTQGGGSRVYVVTKDNTAQARDVTVGYISSQLSQITSGLKAGEIVITQKPQDLKDGGPVKVIDIQK